MGEGLYVRELSNEEGNKLLRVLRGLRVGGDPGTGTGGAAVGPAHGGGRDRKVAFTSPNRVREVINNFTEDGTSVRRPRVRSQKEPSARAGRHGPPLHRLAEPPCCRRTLRTISMRAKVA